MNTAISGNGSTKPRLKAQLEFALTTEYDEQQRKMLQAHFSAAGFWPGSRVLNIGCGAGVATKLLSEIAAVDRLVAIEESAALLAQARILTARRSNVSIHQAVSSALPFINEAFDAVVFHAALCREVNVERALTEAWRVLVAAGWLILIEPDFASASVAHSDNDPLQQYVEAAVNLLVDDRWRTRHLPTLTLQIGFDIKRIRSYGYMQIGATGLLRSLADYGIETLSDARYAPERQQRLKAELRSASVSRAYFGQMTYLGLIARKSS